ncbi:jg11391 [Pararge aegeria aegeria]|uniref:Jg11391 protein n=1 Tax=Pararge aegeria aegeria TaxID=348720 RepID=A0A8S4RJ15_9NEOP|nr:jg11391 [Pararge aegeria aegeria]
MVAAVLCLLVLSCGLVSAIYISLASTVKENIVRKPACLRVLHNVLKDDWSPPIRTGQHGGLRPQPLLIVGGDSCLVISDSTSHEAELVMGVQVAQRTDAMEVAVTDGAFTYVEWRSAPVNGALIRTPVTIVLR